MLDLIAVFFCRQVMDVHVIPVITVLVFLVSLVFSLILPSRFWISKLIDELVNYLLMLEQNVIYGSYFCFWNVASVLWSLASNIATIFPHMSASRACEMCFKGDLRPKNHPGFYGINLMVLWKKSLVQSFVVLWSIFTKGLNPVWETSYPRVYKTFHPWLSLHILVNFMWKRTFDTAFCVVFDNFSSTYEVAKFWIIKLCLDISEVIHANEYT